MRVVLAHPGQQHSIKVARALKENGVLFKYITSIYDTPNSITMTLLRWFLRGEDKNKLLKRREPFLGDDVITFYTFLSLCVIALSRFKSTKRLSYRLDRRISDAFGIRVAKYAIKHEADVVICFSMNETLCFEYLKKHSPKTIRVVDCANSPVSYMSFIYDHDKYRDELKKEVPSFWNKKELIKQQRGIDSTDFFLAPSSFVKQGLEFCGVDSKRVFTLHYGNNFPEVGRPKLKKDFSSIRLIYVGQVTFRKGLPYLLEAFSRICDKSVYLDIVGGWKPDSIIYQQYKDNPRVNFYGHVSHDKVKSLLLQSDVFVFASLTEGFSLSVLEAMSIGLPVVCSSNCGTNDIVVDGYNGFTFDYYDVEKLCSCIEQFIRRNELINAMGIHAYETAMQYTWGFYSENLGKIVKEFSPFGV